MSEHRLATRRSKISSPKVRAILGLGMMLGVAQLGTLASWSDTATVASGNFQTGTLDLKVGEAAADQLAGQTTQPWTHASLAMGNMTPGESVARLINIQNAGSVALKYTPTLAATNNDLTNNDGLKITVVRLTQPVTSTMTNELTNTGNEAAGTRAGACPTTGASTLLNSINPPAAASPTNLHAQETLTAGQKATYCVLVKLPASAPNSLQGKTTSLNFVFPAVQ